MSRYLKIMLTFAALIVAMMLFSGIANAAPGLTDSILYSQPDGKSFEAKRLGDEYFNYLDAGDGFALVQDADGWWCYAIAAGDSYKIGARYPQTSVPQGALTVANIGSHIDVIEQSNSTDYSSICSSGSMLGAKNTLVVLVSFSNAQIRQSESFWSNHVFGLGGQIPNTSVRQYYRSASNDAIDLVPASESWGANDGVISIKLSSAHPGSNYSNIEAAVKETLTRTAPYINYASFDKNGNKLVTSDELHMIIMFAGSELSYSSATPGIWAHCSSYSNGMVRVNGIAVGAVTCRIGEYCGANPTTIGPICHELGHSMGLIDLYDYDSSSLGVGSYSIMGTGSWGKMAEYGDCPAQIDAFSKVRLGIANVQVATNGSYSVNTQDSGAQSIIKVPTGKSNEYYLLENREVSGYDSALKRYMAPNAVGGIAIWHIDENCFVSGGNNNEAHKTVGLVEANSGSLGYSQLDKKYTYGYDHFFTSTGVSTFADNTNPSAHLYSGASLGYTISVMSAPSARMTVNVTSGIALKVTSPATALSQSAGTTNATASNNHSVNTAAAALCNKDMVGTLTSASTLDYYSFSITKSSRITFKLTPQVSLKCRASVYNSKGKRVGYVSAYNKTGSLNVTLPKGAYYLAMDGMSGTFGAGSYAVSINMSESSFVAKVAQSSQLETAQPTATQAPAANSDGKAIYRALIIGESNYVSADAMPASNNNISAISALLGAQRFNGSGFGSVQTISDARSQEIYDAMSRIASATDSDDVTYFYFTGHSTSINGAAGIQLSDGSAVSLNQLGDALSQINGSVVAILDCDGTAQNFASAAAAEFCKGTFTCVKPDGSSYTSAKVELIASTSGALVSLLNQAGSVSGAVQCADANQDGAVSFGELSSYILSQNDASAPLNQIFMSADSASVLSIK